MEGHAHQKILVAVDDSEQSLRAIRYAANVFPPNRTQIVLFHVRAQLYELFSELDAYPLYQKQMTGLKRWSTEQKADVVALIDSAKVYFRQKGFPEDAITSKTPAKKLGVVKDIIKESYDGYQAIVVGRTGWSRFKDWLLKSTAMKLVGKIKHIPVVVVGGQPDAKHMLVAFDGTHDAMKGVACIGSLVGASGHHLQIYSMIGSNEKFWEGVGRSFVVEKSENCAEIVKHKLSPSLKDAFTRLLTEGMIPERISIKIDTVDQDRASRIVEEAMENDFGEVVLGRRGLVNFIEAYIIGRVSAQVLKQADHLAVWII